MADNDSRGPGSTLRRIAARKAARQFEGLVSKERPQRWSERFSDGFVIRWLRALEPVGFVVGVVALVVAAATFVVDLYDRQEARVVRAWQLVTTDAPGNSGKREALEYLNRRETIFGWPAWQYHWAYDLLPLKRMVPLVGIDLSVEPGGTGAYLVGVDLRGADLRNARLEGANLRGADLSDADLSGIDLRGADLQGADLNGATLRSATVVKANLAFSNLTGLNASKSYKQLGAIDLADVVLDGANLSGAILTGAGLVQEQLGGAWACEGHPPVLPDGVSVDLVPCDANGCRANQNFLMRALMRCDFVRSE